jgi:hypothetical protein
MSPISTVSVVPIDRKYPHVDGIEEPNTQQTARLLWEKIFTLTERLTAAEATITKLVTAHNTNETAIADVKETATSALIGVQAPTGTPGSGGTPSGGPGEPGGEIGCQAAGSTGHDSGGLLNSIRAGQIVCGTGNEWITLRNPVPNTGDLNADSSVRQANQEQLLRRMIWHLQLAGFSAGRQQNPSGVISKDKLTVTVDGVLRAYDIFQGVDPYTQIPQHMVEVTPAHAVADAGIPD